MNALGRHGTLRSALVSIALQAAGLALANAEPAAEAAPPPVGGGTTGQPAGNCLAWLAEHYPWLGPTAWAASPTCQPPPRATLLRHAPAPPSTAPSRPTQL